MRNNKDRIIHLVQILTRILILPIMCAIGYGIKSYVPMVLGMAALVILLGISRIKLIGQRFQDNEESRKEYKKIVTRSVILGPIIAIAFITLVVFIRLKLG